MAFDPVQKILAVGTQTGALRLYPLFHFLFHGENEQNHTGKVKLG